MPMKALTGLKARWDHAGETKTTRWKDTRRALILGGFSLSTAFLGTIAWVSDTRADSQRESRAARLEAETSAYNQEMSDYQRCLDRAKSGAELKAALLAGVDHAEDTEAVFVLMQTLIDRTGNVSESAEKFSSAVDEYAASIDEYRASSENYEVVDLDECPPVPAPPTSED